LIFPGQGTALSSVPIDLFAEFGDLTAAADGVLGYSVAQLCLNARDERLRDTRFAQPAIYFVNALFTLRRQRTEPDGYRYFAGHSLGEYNALVAAGHLDLIAGLRLVNERARLMAQIPDGGMVAVIGLASAQVESALLAARLAQVYVANRNSDEQTTVAGHRSQLVAAAAALKAVGARQVMRLNVSGPFHTPLMAPAAEAFATVLAACEIGSGHAAVVSSITGERFDHRQAATLLGRQITGPVEWVRAVRTLRAAGVTHFDEIAGRTLTSLINSIG
jgi:[acyl-carrier-protein] S-malonyltransferase